MDPASIVQAVTAVIVAAFTIVLAVVASRQAGIMQNQADIFQKQTDIQNSALQTTQTAAEAAKLSAEVAERSLTNVERPYLTVLRIDRYIFWTQRAQETNANVEIRIKNYGRTPAFLLEVKAAFELISTPTGPQHIRTVPPIPIRPLEELVVIGSDDVWSFPCRYSNRISDGEKAQIEHGEFELWLFVSLRYEDIFQKQHTTQARFKYVPSPHSSAGEKFAQLPDDDYTVRT
jgi:hypothetical protein